MQIEILYNFYANSILSSLSSANVYMKGRSNGGSERQVYEGRPGPKTVEGYHIFFSPYGERDMWKNF